MGFEGKIYPECFDISTKPMNKAEILQYIAKIAQKAAPLKKIDSRDIFQQLQKREEMGSTGFGQEIAIPHCSLPGIDQITIGLVRSNSGIDFDAADGRPVQLFAFIISPQSNRSAHIKALAVISRILNNPKNVKELLGAQSSNELFQTFSNLMPAKELAQPNEKQYLFHVLIQDEDKFNDILSVFTELDVCRVSVMEMNNAGYYLHQMPLFASFWTENESSFNRLIVAAVNTNYLNDTMRRLHLIEDELDNQGMMIMVQELCFFSGALNF
ncbi:PTS sugar transporter subunit IIA [bacterium]|nr:PTS sugar transporter subunit IIA [bacterium]